MDRKSVQAVLVTIFSGVLFLESMFAGGVASEETGKVLDAMRGLRRVNNVHYLVTNSYSGNQDIVQQTQEVWADLLDETWMVEYKNTDADGAMTYVKEFCDGVTVNSYQAGTWSEWNGYSTTTDIPNYQALTNPGYREEDIVSAETADLDDGAKQIIFSLSGQQLKEKRDQALDLIEPAGFKEQDDTEQMDKMSVYYEQYQKTGYQNERIVYTINKSGVLTGMEYSFDVKRPKVVIKGGVQKLEGEEQYAMGVKIEVLSYNQANIPKVIRKCAADAGYDR